MTVLDHHYVDIALVRAFEELTGQTVKLAHTRAMVTLRQTV